MTRKLARKLMWNGVIYGAAFGLALLVAALIDYRDGGGPLASAVIDHPIAETSPATSVAEADIR